MKKLLLLCMMAFMLVACGHSRQEESEYKYQCDISYTVQDKTGQTFTPQYHAPSLYVQGTACGFHLIWNKD